MAYDPDQLSAFGEVLKRVADEGKKPRAILLSGGGNDIAGPQLTMLLNHRRSKTPPLDDKMASELFENRLQLDMLTLISAVSELCHRYFPKEPVIPIFIHGYDHPVPDGRGYLGGFWFLPGPWLKPAFDTKGYQDNNNDLQLATNVMGELIDKYNKVLLGIPNLPGMSYVHYVHIFGSLSNDLTKYKDDWGNELHPTRSGFERVADIFAKEIDKASKK
jgi:lysophospholipase L1-like esterase